MLHRQYWTASGGWSWRIWKTVTNWLILPVTVLVIGSLISVLGYFLFSGRLARDPGSSYSLIIATIAAVISFSHAGWVLRELIASRSLAVASVLPDSDRDYLSSRLNVSLKKTLMFLAGSLFLGAGIAFGAELNVVDTIQVLLISALLWAMTASLSVIIPAFLPVIVRQEAASVFGGLIMLLTVTASGLIALGIARQETVIFAVLAALPTGWPILLIKHGVFLKQPEAWWLLLPVCCFVSLAVAGYFRLLSRYRIQEFTYEPGSLAIADFRAHSRETSTDIDAEAEHSRTEIGHAPPAATTRQSDNCLRQLKRWLRGSESDGPSEELTKDQAIARIHETGLTQSFDWSEAGFVERAVARFLNDEELLSAEILSAGRPRWSWSIARSLVPASVGVLLVVTVALFVHRQIAVICGHIGLAGLIAMFVGGRWASLWSSDNGSSCAALALLPIDDRHVSRVWMTLGAIRSVLIFPFAVSVIAAIIWGHRGRIELMQAVLPAAKIVLIIVALHRWWFLIGQPVTVSQTFRKNILAVIVAITVFGTMITGVCLLLMSGQLEVWNIAGAGLLFGTGWVAQRIHRHGVLKSPTDFVISRPAQHSAAQRQQKRRESVRGPAFWPRPVESAELSL